MNHELTKRHFNALRKLREECDYEDSRSNGELIFVSRNKLSPGIGHKTLSELEGWRMIEVGINRWYETRGYRLTELGRREIEANPLKTPKPKTKHKLRFLPPRLGKPK